MSFTILSVILLLIIAITLYISVLRGMKRGLLQSAVHFATVLLSALAALIPATLISDYPTDQLASTVIKNLPFVSQYKASLPSLPNLITAALDALLTPVVFVILFPLVFWFLRLCVRLCFAFCRLKKTDDPRRVGSYAGPYAEDNPDYTNAHAPWYVRRDRVLGGIVGGVCGFFTLLLFLSPVSGTFSTASNLFRNLENENVNISGLNNKTVDAVKPYINDSVIATLNAAGGNLIYDALATSQLTYVGANNEIKQTTISLRRELDECMSLSLDLVTVFKSFSSTKSLNAEQQELLGDLGERINSSGAVRVLASDFVTGACKNWLMGKKYLSMSRPQCGEFLDPVMNGIFSTCALSTPDCVGNDIETLIHVYQIMLDAGLTSDMSQNGLNAVLENDEILDRIYNEIAQNPCMAPLTVDLVDEALYLMARTLDLSDLSQVDYEALLNKMYTSLRFVNSMDGATLADQVERMTEETIYYAEDYNINLPKSVTEMAVTSIVQQLGNKKDLRMEDLESCLQQALKDRNGT